MSGYLFPLAHWSEVSTRSSLAASIPIGGHTWSPTTSISTRGQHLVIFCDQYIDQRSVPGYLLPPVYQSEVSTWSTPTISTSIGGRYLVISCHQYINWDQYQFTPCLLIRGQYQVTFSHQYTRGQHLVIFCHQYIDQRSAWVTSCH